MSDNLVSLRRVLNELSLCGCGSPDDAWDCLCEMLTMFRRGEVARDSEDEEKHNAAHKERWDWFDADPGQRFLLAYFLDRHGLTEHGGNVLNSWLKTDGDILLDWLEGVQAAGGEYDEAVRKVRSES